MFDFIRLQYIMGKIDEDQVKDFCTRKLITKSEQAEILAATPQSE